MYSKYPIAPPAIDGWTTLRVAPLIDTLSRSGEAIALTTDSSILTAVGNDYGYDRIFARQVEALPCAARRSRRGVALWPTSFLKTSTNAERNACFTLRISTRSTNGRGASAIGSRP